MEIRIFNVIKMLIFVGLVVAYNQKSKIGKVYGNTFFLHPLIKASLINFGRTVILKLSLLLKNMLRS